MNDLTQRFSVTDALRPVTVRAGPGFERILTITRKDSERSEEQLWYRAAEGGSITRIDGGWFQVDERYFIQVESDSRPGPLVRAAGNRQELLIGVDLQKGGVKVVQRYAW